MAFKKQFQKEDFIKALSSEWKKTREIAEDVGCKNLLATKTLLSMPDEVEWQWTKGGKVGTREWRLRKECEK
ncbi:hypothetical protein DU52_15795 [Methanosarcina mazei]|uniref:Uncharacterized protein n=1 Tax=Methanosarcina mazei TaxID=2209 RepID=A0A0F8E6I8_METMZ|nr:hypothetical protein [Methanosarcina mazei]KKG35386.1 hypothetical protein DU52_15795 [Methanosarcina mazei]